MIYIDASLGLFPVTGVRNVAWSHSPALFSAEVACLTVGFLLEMLISGHSPESLTHLQAWTTCDLHRRRDDSACGQELSAEKKMAQPGTGAEAMERPVQSARVRAEEHDDCESTRNCPRLLRIHSTSPSGAGVADRASFWRFLLLPEVTSGSGSLKDKDFTFLDSDSP